MRYASASGGEFSISGLEGSDFARVLSLNNDAVPHVNALTGVALRELVAGAALVIAVRAGTTVAGFLVAFAPGADYSSPNYRWFSARYREFLYVDRIVVDPELRGQGLAGLLYGAVFEAAYGRPVCCEVNLRPPNPGSLRFHLRLGLREVGRQETDGGTKEVALLASAPPD